MVITDSRVRVLPPGNPVRAECGPQDIHVSILVEVDSVRVCRGESALPRIKYGTGMMLGVYAGRR